MGACNSAGLCGLGVFVSEAAESVSSDDFDVGVDEVRERLEWAGVVQCPVRAVAVEVGFVLDEDFAQVAGVRDGDPVEGFAACAGDPAFRDRVHPWSLWCGDDDPDLLGAEDLVERRDEFCVAVTDQEFEVTCVVSQLEYQVVGLLGDPVGGDTQRLECSTTA